MKKRVLSLFLAIALCLTLTPTGALAAEGQPPEQTVSVTQEAQIPAPAAEEEEEEKKTTSAENGADENDPPANPEENPTEDAPAAPEKNSADEEPGKETGKETGQNEPTVERENEPLALGLDDAAQNAAEGENGEAGDTSISEEDTRTVIWRDTQWTTKISRPYDGTTNGNMIPFGTLDFTDGTNSYPLTEGTDFTATKTFDSADAGNRTVTVALKLIDDAAAKYKLKAGKETFTIGGCIDQATPNLTVSLSQTTCAVGETLPLVTSGGAPEGATVTYYYTTYTDSIYSDELAGLNEKIDENTTIPEAGTYYIFARSTATTNYKAGTSEPVQLKVVAAAARVTTADGVNSYYEDTDIHAAFDAAASAADSTLTLLQDVTLADKDSIYIDSQNGYNFTIDWNGHTLTGNDYHNLLTLTGVTSVTLQDSSGNNTGGVCNNGSGAAVYISLTSYECSVTIEGGTYSPQVNKNNCSGAVKISGGVFKGTRALITTYRGDADGTLADLLAAGCTFAYDDGSGTKTPFDVYSTYMSDSGKTVCVIPHTAHTFDNTGKCTVCGYTCPHTEIGEDYKCTSCEQPMAAMVTKDGKSRGYTDFAAALANAPEGSTLKLLIDSNADATLDKALTLDLNGKQIRELRVMAKATIKDSTGGSGHIGALVIRQDLNLTLGDLPEEGSAFRGNHDEWVAVTDKAANDVSVQKAPIQGLTIKTDKDTYTPGETITLTATAQMSGTEIVDFQWAYDGMVMEGNPAGSSLQDNQRQRTASGGTHTVTCTAHCGGYAFTSQPYTITVEPIDLSGATVSPKVYTYTGTEQCPKDNTVTVTLNGSSVSWAYYDVVAEKQTDAGSYTLTITGKGNYKGTIENVPWKINPAALTVSAPSEVKKAYDGTTNATVTPTFNGLKNNENLTAADYSVTAAFEDAKVGYKKIVTGKVTLKQTDTAKNYVLKDDGNFSTDNGIIAKAAAPTVQPVELTIYNGVQKDYFVDLPPLPDLDEGKFYGKVDYSVNHPITLPEGYTAQSAVVADPDNLGTYRLLLHMTQTGSLTGEIGTVTIPVTTSNYQDIILTVKVKAITQVTVAITPNGGTYGSVTAAAAKLSGVADGETVPVTLTYTGNGYNSTAVPTNAGSYTVTASIADSNYVLTGETTANFVIEPKSIKGAKVVLGKGLTANGAEQTQTVEKVLLDGKEIPADSYTVAGNTATDPGSPTLTITAKGNYTGTVKQTYVIAPAKAADAPGEEIAIGSGKVKVDVKSEGAVPPTTLLTNKAELLAMLVDSGDITADELAQIADGASVDIALTVKEANVSAEIKTAMAQAAKGCTIGQYLDISLFKYMTVNGKQQDGVALHTTKNALAISVAVPDALINTNSAVNRTYCIVRSHEGTITVLDAAFDAASKTLTFKTDRFSDYAIAYKDTAVPSSGSNPGSNNSSNGSETKKNEVAAPTPTPTPASTSKPSTITAAPQTGDTSNPTLYVVLLVASLLGLAVVFVCKKRNDK